MKTCQKIQNSQKEFILTKQLLRSGTAVGALYHEAQHAESKLDFIHKLAIAQKECNESLYWMELMLRTDIIQKQEYEALDSLCKELIRILTSSIRTVKSKLN